MPRKGVTLIKSLHISPELLPSSSLLPCGFLESCNHSVYKRSRSHNRVINLASDKCCGLVGTRQKRMERNTITERNGEACRSIVLTVSGSSFSGISVISMTRHMKYYTLVVVYVQLPMPYKPFKDEGYLFCIRTQCVPHCKHSPFRL
jgi:hypothetical protein